MVINHTDEPLEETIHPAQPPVQVVEVERDEKAAVRDGGFPVSLGLREASVYNVTW
jgi:hypothetical protein